MRIYACADYRAMSRRAASLIAAQVLLKPDCVLGLATGSTPVGLYRQLAEWHQQGDLSFAGVRSVNLDEYLGLAPDHEQSYRRFMQVNLFDHIDIRPEHTHVLNGLAPDPQAECAAYDQLIRKLGGVDLQLLGMGHNGHIAFNEPGDDFGLETHVVRLSERTIDANQRFFASRDEVPRQALTLTMSQILAIPHAIAVVPTARKARAVADALRGPVCERCPASALRRHTDARLYLDADSASLL